jgi:hypothetical protein
MSYYGTVVSQGSFVSDGNARSIPLPSGVDYFVTQNWTQSIAQANNSTVTAWWYRGFPANSSMILQQFGGGGQVLQGVYNGTHGFTYIDSSINNPGAGVAITAISGANPPVVDTGSTAGLSNGSIVRIINVIGAEQISGMDFTIGGLIANTSFTLANMPAIAAAAAPGANAVWRKIPYYPYFYPSRRYITAITQAAQAVVTVSVNHQYVVGQLVRFSVPAAFGMVQMDQLVGEITAVTAGTFTVNIDSSAFTAFAFPLNAAVPFSQAVVVPLGEGTDSSIANPNLLDDATVNQAFTGMLLSGGNLDPAGNNNDLIYWQAMKVANL